MATSVSFSPSAPTPITPPTTGAYQYTPAEKAWLSQIRDPEQRAIEELKLQLAHQPPATGPNFTPTELALLSKIKNPSERAQLEAQLRYQHAVNSGAGASQQPPANVAWQPGPIEQAYLSSIRDPEQRAIVELQMRLAHEPVPTGPGLSPTEKALLSKIKDPAQRAQLETQMLARHGQPAAPTYATQTSFDTAGGGGELSAFEQQYLSAIADPAQRESTRQQFIAQHQASARGETPPDMNLPWPPNAGGAPAGGSTGSTPPPGPIELGAFELQYLSSIPDPAQREAMRQKFIAAHEAEARGEAPDAIPLPWPPTASASAAMTASDPSLAGITDPNAYEQQRLRLLIANETPQGARLSPNEQALLNRTAEPYARAVTHGELIARRAPQGLSPFTADEQAKLRGEDQLKERALLQLRLMARHVVGAQPLSASDKMMLTHMSDPVQRAITALQLTVQSAR
jgi:hypothetical protein